MNTEMGSVESIPGENRKDLSLGISDQAEAKDYINKLLAGGVKPKISVPKRFLENVLKEGSLSAKKSWIPKFSILVGTLNIDPYSYSTDKERVIFEVTNPEVPVEPRFTGKDKKFHGIIYFPEGHIDLKDLKRVN
ncbi:MAG: hypothetical protein WC526_01180 [Patescibacteria group bacterium]